MKHQTFESYLQDIHAKNYTGTDDDMPDAFDTWISELDGAEIMELAEVYGEQQFELGCSKDK